MGKFRLWPEADEGRGEATASTPAQVHRFLTAARLRRPNATCWMSFEACDLPVRAWPAQLRENADGRPCSAPPVSERDQVSL